MEGKTSGLHTIAVCSGACPLCCQAPETINIRIEAELRHRALTLSSAVGIIMVFAHIWFSIMHERLDMPIIVWALIAAPWCGNLMPDFLIWLKGDKIKRIRKDVDNGD